MTDEEKAGWSDLERAASLVVGSYAAQEPIGFAYGQGSAFTRFSADSDVDVVIIWDLDMVPESRARRAARPGGTRHDPVQFDGEFFALDKLRVDGRDVDVAHYTRASFESWCGEVDRGDGWQTDVWPLPLHSVAGFVYGTILADTDGSATRIREAIRIPSPRLVAKTAFTLTQELDGYASELQACVRRDDAWLLHHLAGRLMKHSYVAWFAAEGYYCPFPTHLWRWIRHLGLKRRASQLEEEVWASTTLPERVAAVVAFASHVASIEN
jgi:hypothetical protein